jgi:pentatricopeptide repeat protein
MSHIYALSKDMQQSGIPLRPEQQILALEAIFIDGWENEAIENHRRHVSTLGANPETFVPFWQLGLQMYCRVGDLERAERIASTILESPYKADPRFIQPLIKLCAETPAAVEKGFGLYRGLRASLGDSMTIEDYDTVISYFLASGNTEHALFIFVDMMKSGSVDLVGVRQYPPSVANPFFFGKWLKRLIGAGELEGASSVLRFMRSQGITPRAIQVNGLIGAWLRSGAADNVQNAEDVAWAMINARIQFVELRRRKSSLAGINLYPSGDAWPRANLETFSLLAENYKERGLTGKMGPLWQSFQEAEIAPDSFMLNQLLLSRLQEGGGETVQAAYQETVSRFNLKPDSHTFMALWQALPANRFTRIHPKDFDREATRTRALFAEMIKYASVFKSGDGMEMDNFLARNILHSFRKIQDRVGLLLAYRALRRIFKYNPPDMVIFELLIGTLDLERLAKRREGSKLIRARTSLDHYLAHRQRELVKSGEIVEGEGIPLEMRAEETGNFLELQLETAFSEMKEEDAQRLAIEVAEEMDLQTRATQDAEICSDS